MKGAQQEKTNHYRFKINGLKLGCNDDPRSIYSYIHTLTIVRMLGLSTLTYEPRLIIQTRDILKRQTLRKFRDMDGVKLFR